MMTQGKNNTMKGTQQSEHSSLKSDIVMYIDYDHAAKCYRNQGDLSTLSFEKLVSLRSRHQTRQAASGVRKKTTSGRDQTHAKLPTERQLLLRRFQEIIKEQQEQGAGTGAERGLRWRMGNAPAAGNAANAAAAAKTRHKKVCQPPIFTDIVTRY